MPISLGFSKWGCLKGRNAHTTVKEASLCHEGAGESPKKARVARDIFFYYFSTVFVSRSFCGGKRGIPP